MQALAAAAAAHRASTRPPTCSSSLNAAKMPGSLSSSPCLSAVPAMSFTGPFCTAGVPIDGRSWALMRLTRCSDPLFKPGAATAQHPCLHQAAQRPVQCCLASALTPTHLTDRPSPHHPPAPSSPAPAQCCCRTRGTRSSGSSRSSTPSASCLPSCPHADSGCCASAISLAAVGRAAGRGGRGAECSLLR